jgi:hypothetical protein
LTSHSCTDCSQLHPHLLLRLPVQISRSTTTTPRRAEVRHSCLPLTKIVGKPGQSPVNTLRVAGAGIGGIPALTGVAVLRWLMPDVADLLDSLDMATTPAQHSTRAHNGVSKFLIYVRQSGL